MILIIMIYSEDQKMTLPRSRESIINVVMKRVSELRDIYNKRLVDDPSLYGKITVKYSIDYIGNVIKAKVVSSTVNDTKLEGQIAAAILEWDFDTIDNVNDITEIVYPFIFTSTQSFDEVNALDLEKNKKGTREVSNILSIIKRNRKKINKLYCDKYFSELGRSCELSILVNHEGNVKSVDIINAPKNIPPNDSLYKSSQEEFGYELIDLIYEWDFKRDLNSKKDTKFSFPFQFQFCN